MTCCGARERAPAPRSSCTAPARRRPSGAHAREALHLGELLGGSAITVYAINALAFDALSTGDAESAALSHHEHDGQPFEKARTQLAYGERLRRERRRADAREQLGEALDVFERLGAQLWADRARVELRATGGAAAEAGGGERRPWRRPAWRS